MLDEDKKHASRWTPYWQAAPLAIVFLVFFILPLADHLHRSASGPITAYSIEPAFVTDQNYVHAFDKCFASLPELCTTFRTYISTLKFSLIVWIVTLRDRLHRRLLPRLPGPKRRPPASCCALLRTIPFWTSNVIRMISLDPAARPQRAGQPDA